MENSWEADVIKYVFQQKQTPMAREILASLSDQQLTHWKRLLLAGEGGSDIHEFLNKTLSEVYGLETTFFKDQDRDSLAPLYFYHQKKTIVEGTELTEKVIDYRGSTYFPYPN